MDLSDIFSLAALVISIMSVLIAKKALDNQIESNKPKLKVRVTTRFDINRLLDYDFIHIQVSNSGKVLERVKTINCVVNNDFQIQKVTGMSNGPQLPCDIKPGEDNVWSLSFPMMNEIFIKKGLKDKIGLRFIIIDALGNEFSEKIAIKLPIIIQENNEDISRNR